MSAQRLPRILHVVETLPGGPAAYLNEILPWQLRRSGRDRIALVAPQGQFDHLTAAARDGLAEFPYPRSGRDPAALYALHRALRRCLKTWLPDLVHAHSSFAGLICRLRRLPAPLVYCPHGWAFSRETTAAAKLAYRLFERGLQTRADAIIAISEHEREQAIAAGLDDARLITIRHGLHIPPAPLPERPSRPAEAPLELLFIGRFDRQKGLDWLLDALATVPTQRVALTVVGASVVDAPPALATRDNVRHLGWLSPAQIARQIDQADALIMPSRWEGFGLVAIEAMRRGLPVLASNRGALPEVIGDAGVLFDLDDPRALPKLLDTLTRQRLHDLGEAGRRRFAALFDADRMNMQTWSLYESVRARCDASPASGYEAT